MGWSIGYDEKRKRDIGYGVPAYCDHPGCKAVIDRGLGYVCGGEPYGGEHGCGLFICSEHTHSSEECLQLCEHCAGKRAEQLVPSPDHPDWMEWKLSDSSWQEWRGENLGEVEKIRSALREAATGKKERPILMSGPMVRATLAGDKTQTRRIIRRAPDDPHHLRILGPSGAVHYTRPEGDKLVMDARSTPGYRVLSFEEWLVEKCPYGKVGDRLWVRESFCKIIGQSGGWIETDFKATYQHGSRLGDSLGVKKKWTPSIHMPRAASRILLEITSVRVERLQDISEPDALAEGIEKNWIGDPTKGTNGFGTTGWVPDCGWINYMESVDGDPAYTPLDSFKSLWRSINGRDSWEANPWLWVIEFKRVTI